MGPAASGETASDSARSMLERVVWRDTMNRRTILAGLIGCLCFGAGLQTAVAGPVLIGGSPDGIIYDVDPATGLASNPRDTGISGLRGLAFSPGGVLYARTGSSTGGDQPNSLISSVGRVIDPAPPERDIRICPHHSIAVEATATHCAGLAVWSAPIQYRFSTQSNNAASMTRPTRLHQTLRRLAVDRRRCHGCWNTRTRAPAQVAHLNTLATALVLQTADLLPTM